MAKIKIKLKPPFRRMLGTGVVKRREKYFVIVRKEFYVFGWMASAWDWSELPPRFISRIEAEKLAAHAEAYLRGDYVPAGEGRAK